LYAKTRAKLKAWSLNDLGMLHRAQNRIEEARSLCEEALATHRKLAASNPDTYLPYVASMLNNLGILHSDPEPDGGGAKGVRRLSLQRVLLQCETQASKHLALP
jgi:hypothetical protein